MAGRNFTFRMDDARFEALEARAEESGLSKAEVMRRYFDAGEAMQADRLVEAADLEDRIGTTIEENQTLRNILPSKWEAHVRRLFLKDIQDDASPQDLRYLARRYKKQARQYEERLALIPDSPDVEPGTHERIVDEQLQYALEASDLSNWYERVDNPFEHLQGVEDGKEERETVQAVVKGVLSRHYQIGDTLGEYSRINGVDIPSGARQALPDRFGPEDVADAVNQLADAGVDPEDVDQFLPIIDPAIGDDPVDVESDVVDDETGEVDPDAIADMETEDAVVAGGKLYPNGLPGDQDDQAELPTRIPTADGGRSQNSVFAESSGKHSDSGSESDES